jgi:predicted CXXCH cytochrome family protein
MMGDEPPDLCFGCHTELAQLASATVPHKPVAEGECRKCHNVHSTDNPKMFPLAQTELCFSCHEELGEYISEQEYRHGPIKDGDCNACHDPHGNGNSRILRMYFPMEFYKPYATENYALCFNCHNKDIALDEQTKTLTDFRDKDRNLHFLHVNKEVKGRSCKACHQVHASTQEKHIRESVPYGEIDWELPVSFTKYDDGGKCVVGCHAPKEYHRQ